MWPDCTALPIRVPVLCHGDPINTVSSVMDTIPIESQQFRLQLSEDPKVGRK